MYVKVRRQSFSNTSGQMSFIRIYISTFNRADILAETLESMTLVNREGIDVEWVIINNNCTDHTDEVVRRFEKRLPLRLVHETAPGKNRALNRALNYVALPVGIAVFTDDDVSPHFDWLNEIVASCEHWPEHDVFGGRIQPRWPGGRKPDWLRQPGLLSIAFAWHDHGDEAKEYPPTVYPFGPNFWVRSRVFQNGLRYRESFGPVGHSRIMGSESSFLIDLEQLGHRMVYCPTATVEHRIKDSDCNLDVLKRRMMSHGRGGARLRGVNYRNLLTDHPFQWWLRQRIKLALVCLRMSWLRLAPKTSARTEQLLWQYSYLGWIEESFVMARENSPSYFPSQNGTV